MSLWQPAGKPLVRAKSLLINNALKFKYSYAYFPQRYCYTFRTKETYMYVK